MGYRIEEYTVEVQGVRCNQYNPENPRRCTWFSARPGMTHETEIGKPCTCGGTVLPYKETRTRTRKVMVCNTCHKDEDTCSVRTRHSLGIYAGHYCSTCWEKSGYRQDGPEGFDPMDAGESYEATY